VSVSRTLLTFYSFSARDRVRQIAVAHLGSRFPAARFIEPAQITQKVDASGTLVDLVVNAPPRVTELLGFAYATDAPAQDYVLVTIPLLLPALLLAVPPALALIARRGSRRRSRSGQCPTCGYDLRANVSGVCPECGAAGGGAAAYSAG